MSLLGASLPVILPCTLLLSQSASHDAAAPPVQHSDAASSLTRRSYLYPGFIDAERADHVIKMAKARLAPSGLALRKGDRAEDQR